jgi:ABC-type uncharacterized transport system permease subunit
MNRRQIPYLIIALLIAVAASLMLEAPAPVRIPVMLCFLLLAPGMAFVPLLQLPQHGYELTLGVALSLLLEALVVTVLVEMRIWSLELSLEVLGSLTLIGCALQIYWPAAHEEEPEMLEANPDEYGWSAP